VPPFNGFVSEWLMLQTLLRSAEFSATALRLVLALCGAVLALTAALAVTCFVKAFAMGFLGISRSDGPAKASEAPLSAIAPMTFLAVLCLLLGILPTFVVPALNPPPHGNGWHKYSFSGTSQRLRTIQARHQFDFETGYKARALPSSDCHVISTDIRAGQ
jgi:formate hydrogenlyase subunit 3/multisubunit Na+/H+ antiporter MnhD subunit